MTSVGHGRRTGGHGEHHLGRRDHWFAAGGPTVVCTTRRSDRVISVGLLSSYLAKEYFQLVDTDGTGELKTDQIELVMRALGYNPAPNEFDSTRILEAYFWADLLG